MEVRGGYLPRIQGRPSATVQEWPLPERLLLPLTVGDISYQPAVTSGQRVRFGDVLAAAQWSGRANPDGNTLSLPAPAGGRVTVETNDRGCPVRLSLETEDGTAEPVGGLFVDGGKDLGPSDLRLRLARGGVWPLLYECTSGSVPPLDAPAPKAIIVNALKVEPFRTRGNVVLSREKMRFFTGLGFLERLLEGYGRIHLILPKEQSRLAEEIRWAVAGRAWVRPTFAPIIYPVENERVLCKALREAEPNLGTEDPIWVLDVQAVVAVGRCLGEGLPLSERVVAVGGPGCPEPRHLKVRIGTPVSEFLGAEAQQDHLPAGRSPSAGEGLRVLRGGVFTGTVIDPTTESVVPTDDAFFLLPQQRERQFLGFLRPGVERDSYVPAFLSALFPRRPRAAHTGLRGERRPCISCGFCQEVCPAGIMPHLVYRLLMLEEPAPSAAPGGRTGAAQPSEAGLEEAQLAGAELCVNCGLCSYVCPSKLELAQVIEQGQQRIQAELAEEVTA